MSELLIRAALEKRLNALTPVWQTGWPNVAMKPTGNHQKATILWPYAAPSGAGRKASTYFSGIFQITVFVPANSGVDIADARALALCGHFKRGLILNEGGVLVRFLEPSRGPGIEEPDWYGIPVSANWFTHVNR